MKRRAFIKGSLLLATYPFINGCTASPRNLPCYFNLPTVNNNPLFIDSHAHLFNGSDLQISGFIKYGPGQQMIGWDFLRAILGELLELIVWENAPDAQCEIDEVLHKPKNCIENENALLSFSNTVNLSQTLNDEALQKARDDQFKLAITELDKAIKQQKQNQKVSTNIRPLSSQQNAFIDWYESNKPSNYRNLANKVKSPEASSILIFKSESTSQKVSLASVLLFVIEMFQFRTVSLFNLLESLYVNEQPDLIISHLVDFDYWIGNGSAPKSSIPEQVKLMGLMAKYTYGKAHCFVPYCPYRRAVFNETQQGWDPLDLVKNSVFNNGALGVKLYLPMGFALCNNAKMQKVQEDKDGLNMWQRQSHLDDFAKTADFGAKLDKALKELYDLCKEFDIPIMVHSNQSNFGGVGYGDIYEEDYWKPLLIEYTSLKINFGHFGGFGEVFEKEPQVKNLWLSISKALKTRDNWYGDLSYIATILGRSDKLTADIATLKSVKSDYYNVLTYGSDWKMLLLEDGSENYLRALMDGLDSAIDVETAGRDTATKKQIIDKIRGGNAADYLYLKDNTVRQRIIDFHGGYVPNWLNKSIV